MSESIQRLLTVSNPAPRSLTCPTCGAQPGDTCTVTRGRWKGYEAKSSHAARRLTGKQ